MRTAMETQPQQSAEMQTALPTTPCSVVWSRGHAYVLEGFRARWVGRDDRGRPHAITGAEMQRRGWTLTRTA
ncbi:hypothetical protein C8D88_105159 [Lentzea atacamensis]|jgi:hypothetical protein|uniref:Uncharacterized protein n=2 Tax=Lentzea TaxID=165301 RepID=A0A316HZA7_9PSEU|nr:hypothetical protein [Lentzea atacamensis]PWK86118.1 hypothetical protein C8D88_105159 [Lentzea atacamensis]RAS65611.1 hypothetical protein C8D87_104159 [Lentzea atacamensis]